MKLVLDTRFLTEHFYSDQTETKRKTTKKLRELTEKREGILPTIVISEIVQITCEKRGKEMAETRYLALMESGLQIQNLSPAIAKQAGLLKCRHKNVPMGDCIIASTAIVNQARILSDDPHFDNMEEAKRIWI